MSKIRDFYYNIRGFIRNLREFLKLAYRWRPWDYTYTIEVLCVLLEKQAKCLRNGYRSEQTYRRCMTTAGLLRKAYLESHVDKSWQVLWDNNPSKRVDIPGTEYVRMTHEYKISKEYYDKMSKIIMERDKKAEEEREKSAMDHLHKYIKHYWD